MPALSADGAVTGGRSIEVFTGTDMIGLSGYPPNSNVKVEVVRHGFVVGFATKRTDSLGGIVMNHVGGAAGDCWDSRSPDVQPTDTIRTTILKPGGARDTSLVRGVWIDNVAFGSTTITVTGQVALTGPEAVNPDADSLELRINKETNWPGTDGSDLRLDIGTDVQDDGTFTRVINATEADVAEVVDEGETFVEWSDATADVPSELTVAEWGEIEPLLGCPPAGNGPTAPRLLKADDSGTADHVTNQATDLTFSGLADVGLVGAGQGETVTLQVDGTDAGEVTADSHGVYKFTGVNLPARATPHTVRVISLGSHASRNVTVDTAEPRVRVPVFTPSPLHLDGPQELRAIYRVVGEGATLQAKIEHVNPTFTARAFARRTLAADGTAEFAWNAKDPSGFDVQPGRYRMVLQVTDKAGNVTVLRNAFRVAR